MSDVYICLGTRRNEASERESESEREESAALREKSLPLRTVNRVYSYCMSPHALDDEYLVGPGLGGARNN